MKKILLSFFSYLLIFSFSLEASSQSSNQKIDFENPNAKLLESLILQQINEVRKERGLHELKPDSILQLAAKDQAKYNYKNNRIGKDQVKKDMATPFLRVNQFNGNHSVVLESDGRISMGTKIKIKGQKDRVILRTYNDAANGLCSNWKNNKVDIKRILNEDVYNMGVGVVFVPGEDAIFATFVSGSEPYEKRDDIKYSSNSFKLSPYNKEKCKYFLREFGYLPELFSSAVRVKDQQILFYFHDLTLLKSILKSGKDALAIDIIQRNQFECGTGNRLHASPIEDGILLKPVKKGRLLRKNPLKETNEFLGYLGDFPPGLDTNNVELNLLIIQGKCHCSTIIYNNLNSNNLRLLGVDFVIDTLSITADIDSLSKQINFTIPFEKNKSDYQVEDIKPILDSIQLNRFNIKQINITAYSSIEGDPKSNERLQKKRAESMLSAIQQYQLQTVKTSIQTFENWDGFYASLKNSPYTQRFKSLTKEQVRSLVNSDTLEFDLEPYLEDQRKADINILVESIYIDSLTPKLLPGKFEKAIRSKEYIKAKGIQSMMLRNVEKGNLKPEQLFPEYVPYDPENMPIMNNIVAFSHKYYTGNNPDSLFEQLKMELNRFLGIEPNNVHLRYNKQLVELYYWSRNIHYLMIDKEAKINQPRDLFKAIRKLYNSKIDNWKVNQLLLNYHLIAADFYYEHKDFKQRERSLKEVRKIVLKAKLNRDQTYAIAGYFMYQIHMKWAIQIMLPFLEDADLTEDFLFRFLSIAIYDEKQVPEKQFINYLRKALEMNRDRYCKLFGAPNMSFQLLRDKEIKKMYCKTCNSR